MHTSFLTTKRTFKLMGQKMDLPTRSSFSKQLYGGAWTKYNTYIIQWHVVMEKICRWHYLFDKDNFHQQSTSNSYQTNIKFIIEIERENKISFLDVLLTRSNSLISTKVYRKITNTYIYMNWKSFSPNNWK